MEKLFQGIVQPGHSPIWFKTKVKCKCGQEFDTGYWKRDEEIISKEAEICNACRDKERYAGKIKEAESRLPKIIAEIKEAWIEDCGLPGKYLDKTFEGFNAKLQSLAFETMKNYDGEGSIILSSPDLYGVGKTHLVAATINKIITEATGARVDKYGEIHSNHNPVDFTTEAWMLNRIRATYNSQQEDSPRHETEENVYKHLLNIPHLFIDDVGKVRPRDYSFLQGVYYQIIDGRYCSEMPIVLTTNLNLDELEKHIGGACADRLREMCGKNIIKMTGKSQRILK